MVLDQTDPLQLIKDPIAPASRHLKPVYLAASAHPPNFPTKASTQMETVKPHIVPNKKSPLVNRPSQLHKLTRV